jgi:hypothetical protein
VYAYVTVNPVNIYADSRGKKFGPMKESTLALLKKIHQGIHSKNFMEKIGDMVESNIF